MARPVQNAAVCRVNSRVDVLSFEPPAAELLQEREVTEVSGQVR